MKAEFTLVGDKALLRAFKRMSNETKKGATLKRAGRKAHKPLLIEMKNRAATLFKTSKGGRPKNPRFRKSLYDIIITKTKGRGADSEITTGVQGREANKGYWLEYGKRNRDGTYSEPRPFIRPAIMKKSKEVLDGLEKEMWGALKRQWNKR